MQRVDRTELKKFVTECLRSTKLSDPDCDVTAEALVSTDTLGVFTHGTKLLIGYLKKLQGGGYPVTSTPRIEREGPAWAVVDGQAGLGQVGSIFAVKAAIQKAKKFGVAFVTLRNTGHIGAAGHYALQAAKAGYEMMTVACASGAAQSAARAAAVPSSWVLMWRVMASFLKLRSGTANARSVPPATR